MRILLLAFIVLYAGVEFSGMLFSLARKRIPTGKLLFQGVCSLAAIVGGLLFVCRPFNSPYWIPVTSLVVCGLILDISATLRDTSMEGSQRRLTVLLNVLLTTPMLYLNISLC